MTIQHKYKSGQTVTPQGKSPIPHGRYRIVRQLPADAAGNQYRIKSVVDGHERVVRESDLAPA